MSDILIIDDEPGVSWAYAKAARSLGHQATVAGSAEEALQTIADRSFDLALLDIHLPGMSGLDALGRLSALRPGMPVIVLTAYGTEDTAVQAVMRGAFDYLTKPIELADLKAKIRAGLEAAAGRRAAEESQSAGSADSGPATRPVPAATTGIVGKCAAMQEVFKRIGLAAGSDLPVLVEGETGTGKELVAQSIHRHSPRGSGPFVVVNCASLPQELLESELFGHVKGAFTGAVADKPGQVELAAGGTLFLDEVGELPPATQAALLRFTESRRAARVGGRAPYEVDVRIVSATNRRLWAEVEAGRFRRDLYYRLNGLTIVLPPLRSRGADVGLLIDHFLARAAAIGGASIPGAGPAGVEAAGGAAGGAAIVKPVTTVAPILTDEARRRLESHPWPGNVRELRHAVAHAVLMARGGPVRVEHLPENVVGTPVGAGGSGGWEAAGDLNARLARLAAELVADSLAGEEPFADFGSLMAEFERPLLEAALRRFGGNQARLAAAVRLHRTTLRKKLREYGLIESGPDLQGDSEGDSVSEPPSA
jgi:two-component system nitrogen regulation response regulator GlnG